MNFLGTSGEEYKHKIYYIAYMFLVLLALFWFQVGAKDPLMKQAIWYYIVFGTVLGLIPVLFDAITVGKFDQIDTVTIEQPKLPFAGIKNQLIIGVIFAIFFAWKIATTQTAFIPYPQFQFAETIQAKAVISGLFGLVEQWCFFVFLFPTAYAIAYTKTRNTYISLLIALLSISMIFMTFHIFVYGAMQNALFSTFVFSFMNCTLIFFLRASIVGDMMHFTNNFVATLVNAQKIGLVFLG